MQVGGKSLVGHTGTIPGCCGITMHNREEHYTIEILSNLSVIGQTEIFAQMQQVLFEYSAW